MSENTPGDAAALIRAYVRDDHEFFEQVSQDPELVLEALGLAVTMLVQAAGGKEQVDTALQKVIDYWRQA